MINRQIKISTYEIAEEIHKFANAQFYATLLLALQHAAADNWIAFIRSPERYELPCVVMDDLARRVAHARFLAISPLMDRETLFLSIEQDMKDGDAQTWLNTLLQGLARMGIHPIPDQEPPMTPEEQAAIAAVLDALNQAWSKEDSMDIPTGDEQNNVSSREKDRAFIRGLSGEDI